MVGASRGVRLRQDHRAVPRTGNPEEFLLATGQCPRMRVHGGGAMSWVKSSLVVWQPRAGAGIVDRRTLGVAAELSHRIGHASHDSDMERGFHCEDVQ